MESLEIAKLLQEKFPEQVNEIREFAGQVSVITKKDKILDIVKYLKSDPDLHMDYLRDLCGVDYLGKKPLRFEVVYHFFSIKFRHLLRIRAEVPEEDPTIDSLVPLYAGANWHERECFDMFGITFNAHPDLRRILLPEDWEGHPLRKDYPLRGYEQEGEWKRFADLLEKVKEIRKHEWYQDSSAS
ncbi:MAG: NADH-quinone oxidoreductase subunit C [Dissulfurispiraceae bacterium]